MSRPAHRNQSFDTFGVQATIYSPMAVQYPALRKDPEHLFIGMLTLDEMDVESFVRRSMRNIYDLTLSSYPRRIWTSRDRDAAIRKALYYQRIHAERRTGADFHANAAVFIIPTFQTLLRAKQEGFKEAVS